MDEIKDNINTMWINLFNKERHVFFSDIKRVNELSKKYIKMQKKYIKSTIPYISIDIPIGKNIDTSIDKYKVLSKENIDTLVKEMSNVLNWDKILKIVSTISTFLLKSPFDTDKKKDTLYNNIKLNSVNIMIIGSGPVGLFLACYLESYYNMNPLKSSMKVNIVLFDNRIDKPGFRKPYTRQRPFNTSSTYLSYIIPKLYCWNKNKDNLYVNIFMLEYLLYCTAVSKFNINIIYDEYKWDEYKKIIEKGNFNVVFDCTGGRLKTDVINIKPQDIKWIERFNKNEDSINKKLLIKPDKNLVELIPITENKFIKNNYYASISIHKNDKTKTFLNKYDIDIMNKYDLLFLNQLKNKEYNYNEILIIISGIKDSIARNFLHNILTEKYSEYIMYIDVWSIYVRHAIKICDTFIVNKKPVLYIGAGDTIFHSHFIVGAGLNRTLDFSVKCVNMLINLFF